MRIGEIYRQGRCGVSIEIFPPKTPDGDEGLLRTLGRLAPYRPALSPAPTVRAERPAPAPSTGASRFRSGSA